MSTSDQLLGEGAYAKVYADKNSALKITEIKTEDDLTACIREQYVLNMNLPNTVPYHNFFYKWGSVHITLERATTDLYKYLIHNRLEDLDHIRDICVQILQGVYSLHEHHIIHRDLKPDNILIKGNTIWLCDFGLSRQFSTEYGVPTGYMVTRWYRAPEIWQKRPYTEKVDMWSIGCIIHKMIYGTVPGKSLPELEVRIPELKNESAIHTLMKGLLEFDPFKRWDCKRALAFLGHDPIATVVDRPSDQTWVKTGKRKEFFHIFYSKFPVEHRVLAHGLMLFDSTEVLKENMCCSLAIAAIIFRTLPSPIVSFCLEHVTADDICEFATTVCSGRHRLSDWEHFSGSFEEYIIMVNLN